jgi:protein gp37
MAKSKIEWTTETWNPIISGCSIISEGCQNCYAMKMANRLEHMGQEKYKGLTRKTAKGKTIWNGKINIDMNDKALYEPLKTKKPTMYFVNSMTDLFHEDVPFEAIDKIMAVIALTPQHTYQVLTKRDERMYEYFCQSRPLDFEINNILDLYPVKGSKFELYKIAEKFISNPTVLPNLWLGVSIENKETLPRIDNLRKTPAAVRFLSCEPLLQDLGTIDLKGIHWVICGGESGHGARPMHPDWVRSIRNQCKDANIPFFFKQWGEYLPYGTKTDVLMNQFGETDFSKHQRGNYIGFAKVGKKQAGALLDGKEYREMPKL